MTSEKKFCECCGLSIARILEKLETKGWESCEHSETLVRTDGLHFQLSNGDLTKYFTKRNVLSFCEFCGVVLKEDDIFGKMTVMGSDDNGRPVRQYVLVGYECHYCKNKIEY